MYGARSSSPPPAKIISLSSSRRSRSPIDSRKCTCGAKANGKYAGLGGERDLARQNAFIKKGVRFVTTQTDLGFLMMAAGQRTADIRKELAK